MHLEIEKQISCRVPRARLLNHMQQIVKRFGKQHKNQLSDIQELSVAFVGEAEIKKLNKIYRKKNKATDVLSFDYGEIIVCVPVAKKQAARHGVSLSSELELLFVHGLLHVLGFDHEKPKDNKEMREAEKSILGFDGLINLSEYV